MARDPKYLRLADRIAVHGCKHDLNSGFGISGFDVVEFPSADENPAAVKFCRTMLRKGVFEEAGKAEFEEVKASDPDTGDDLQKVVMYRPGAAPGLQEHEIRRNIQKAGAKVAKRALARTAAALEVDDDDDAEDIDLAGDAQRPTAKEKRRATRLAEGGGKKSKKSKAVVEDDEDEEETEEETPQS